jgi:hypothetical protein
VTKEDGRRTLVGMVKNRLDFIRRYGNPQQVPEPNVETPFEESPARAAFERSPQADPVLRMSGRVLAMALKNDAGGQGTLFTCLDKLHASIDEILPIARWLEAEGFVQVLDRPRTGDWSLKLTDKANELMG